MLYAKQLKTLIILSCNKTKVLIIYNLFYCIKNISKFKIYRQMISIYFKYYIHKTSINRNKYAGGVKKLFSKSTLKKYLILLQ